MLHSCPPSRQASLHAGAPPQLCCAEIDCKLKNQFIFGTNRKMLMGYRIRCDPIQRKYVKDVMNGEREPDDH